MYCTIFRKVSPKNYVKKINCNKILQKNIVTSNLNMKDYNDKPSITSNIQSNEEEKRNTKIIDDTKPSLIKKIDGQVPFIDTTNVVYRQTDYDDPIKRTKTILSDDLKQYFGDKLRKIIPQPTTKNVNSNLKLESNKHEDQSVTSEKNDSFLLNIIPDKKEIFPSHCDVLIVGGGVMGMSIAYHIKHLAREGLHVVVVEKDSSYTQASTVRSVGGIRQQFSIPENIELSKYGMEFLRNAKENLSIEGEEPVSVDFHPNGYLTLASEDGFEQLRSNFLIQRECGAKVEFMSPYHIKERFPWMNMDGVAAGVLGLENEGWFDPWSFLLGLRYKSCHLGAKFITGEFMRGNLKESHGYLDENLVTNRQMDHAIVRLPNGEEKEIKVAALIIAAGAWSGEVGRRIGIGSSESGINSIPIPIEPRKRFVYCIHSPNGPGINSPLTIDPDGTYFRREGLGDMYLCGRSPYNEPSSIDLEVDEEYFQDEIWPSIANRVPSFQNLRLRSSWAGYYDYNYFDRNGIIGCHPNFSNVIIASGFSGHGLQQAAGVGRGVAELLAVGQYSTLDLSRFGYDRILRNEHLLETNIV